MINSNVESNGDVPQLEDFENDVDDVWCSPEDEANYQHSLEIEHQRKEQLREILGVELLTEILEKLKVLVSNHRRINFVIFLLYSPRLGPRI